MTPPPVIPTTTLKRNEDGSLHYTREGLRALLQKLVDQTGGSKDRSKNTPPRAAEKTFIPDAEMLAIHHQNGVRDPYLTGMVEGENETYVNARQYSVFQRGKVEMQGPQTDDMIDGVSIMHHVNALGQGLEQYGGSKPGEEPYLRDLVTFTPERMALHWAAILTTMYVKTGAPMPDKATATSIDFDQWVEARDADYVKKVNEIYYKLLGTDRTLGHAHANDTPWDGAEKRMQKIKDMCEKIHTAVDADVAAYVKNKKTGLSEQEKEMVDAAIQSTREKNTAKDPEKTAIHWVSQEIYRARANDAIRVQMEKWFAREVFAEGSGYVKKHFEKTKERESFVLSGGSATGKSLPMSLVCEKIAKGYDPESKVEWKREGLDLNDAVHMKSEVMRALLLEEDFLKYGNRLFYDESAHDERRIIRDEMFKYLGKMLDKKSDDVNQDLLPKDHGPVILHDRRSTYEHETKVLISDKARLNYYYFNLPAEQALQRNLGRGAGDLARLQDPNATIDVATYAPRFVNARNNIGSQASAATRMTEMMEKFAGEDILMPLYSTKAPKDALPPVFGYADVKNKTLHIRRLPRLVDTFDNGELAIPDEHSTAPVPLPVSVRDLSKLKAQEEEERAIANAERAADWVADLVENNGYHVFISTPPECKKTKKINTQFAELRITEKGKLKLTEMDHELYDGIQKENGASSRYQTFLNQLEYRSIKDVKQEGEKTCAVPDTRIIPLLFNPASDYVQAQTTEKPRGKA